jgi:RNA polymerase sigma-70 factor (ECF subfamily)
MAWAMLAGQRLHVVVPGRPRESAPAAVGDEPVLAAEGFADEALPWLDAVHRFSLRLTRGDVAAAEDLAQETFLRAHRFWHTFTRGTNAKGWLFTICRRLYLQDQGRPARSLERPASDIATDLDDLVAESATGMSSPDPEREFFDQLLDDEVVGAIDALPDEFREVLVLSDLGDLQYQEIAEVLAIPLGTVRSRLFRARRILQEQLWDYAVSAGYAQPKKDAEEASP